MNNDYKIISSTGYLSRELYFQIKKLKLSINPFYMVGGMGHTSSVSLGYSLDSKKGNLFRWRWFILDAFRLCCVYIKVC